MIETYTSTADKAQAKGTHYLEEAVRVYLMRDLDGADRWVIDPTCFGEGLYSEYDEIEQSECQCENSDECDAVKDRMTQVPMPDGEELMRMFAEALGYTLTKN